MKCKDFEMNIYLYTELSEEEKDKLQEHLASCISCHQLFLAAQHSQALIQKVAEDRVVIRNAAVLTRKILDKTASKKVPHRRNVLVELFQSNFIKYSFSVLSLMLVMSFTVEFFAEPLTAKKTEVKSGASVVLNSTLFQETFFKYKERKKRTALTACFSPLHPSATYLDCLKSKMK
jgi:hypothetical protein